jgi:hypothetical protein
MCLKMEGLSWQQYFLHDNYIETARLSCDTLAWAQADTALVIAWDAATDQEVSVTDCGFELIAVGALEPMEVTHVLARQVFRRLILTSHVQQAAIGPVSNRPSYELRVILREPST